MDPQSPHEVIKNCLNYAIKLYKVTPWVSMNTGSKNKKISIAHVIIGLDTGGAETMLCKLLFGIDKNKFSQSVISLTDGGTLRGKVESWGIPVHSLGLNQSAFSPNALLRLRKVINQLKPDLLQGWMPHGNFVASMAKFICRKKNIKLFWNIRQSLDNFKYEKKLTELIIRLGAKWSSNIEKVIFNSYSGENDHLQVGYCQENSVVIPNGFDTEVFIPNMQAKSSVRNELGLSEKDFLIGRIGRYHFMKDHLSFLRAAGKIITKYPNIMFVLAGLGIEPENEELTRIINENKLQDNIFLLGPRRDIPRLMASFDISVSNSIIEGFPNIIGESMSCAVPNVVTDAGDSARIVGDIGYVVPIKQSESLANAMEELINLDKEKLIILGEKSRDRIINNFSIQKIVSQYQKIYWDSINDTRQETCP